MNRVLACISHGLAVLALAACAMPADKTVSAGTINLQKDKLDAATKIVGKPVSVPEQQQLQGWFEAAKQYVTSETSADLDLVVLKSMLPAEMTLAKDESLAYLYQNKPEQLAIARGISLKKKGPDYHSIVALYSPALNAVLFTRSAMLPLFKTASANNISAREAFTALMIHELVHASDRIVYAPGVYDDPTKLTSLAVRAIIEGHAQYLTRVICERENCLRGYRMLRDEVVSGIGSESYRANPNAQYSSTLSEFTYFYGERFFTKLSTAERREQAMRNPPTDPVEIRYPQSFPDQARSRRSEQITQTFYETPAPWNLDEVLIYRNSGFVPARRFPRKKILAMESFDVFDSSKEEYGTNVTISWLVSKDRALDTYEFGIEKTKTSRKEKQVYNTKRLNRNSLRFITDAGQRGEITVITDQIIPTEIGKQMAIDSVQINTTVARLGTFVLQIRQRSRDGTFADRSEYVKSLLAALTSE